MRETKWTHGPWVVLTLPTGERYITPFEDGGDIALMINRSDSNSEWNASLMAAAPELYEAASRALTELRAHQEKTASLRRLVEEGNYNVQPLDSELSHVWAIVGVLEAALAKARGEQ